VKRKIVHIDESKCTGCGLCANACHEGAIRMVDGVARLISDSYCDGLGDCLPACPADAITIQEREAVAYDEAAVQAHLASRTEPAADACACSAHGQTSEDPEPLACGCPGTHAHAIERTPASDAASTAAAPTHTCNCGGEGAYVGESSSVSSELRQWPVQIQLAPVGAPYFDGAHLLVAADCTAYAYGNIHADFMRGKVTLIGCPKLDHADYAAKLAAILAAHEVKSLTVLRMEVPCCGGLVQAVKQAMLTAGVLVPWRVVTVTTDGTLLADQD
jgi:Fe-S-cluster-containing hydrogenase component 2